MTSVGTSDFERLAPIRVTNSAEIRLFTANDEITLEYDDRVLLMFTPDNYVLIPALEGMGQYIRDTATVHIIDSDCKCSSHESSFIRASVDALCRDDLSEISRDTRTKCLQTRRESLARPLKHTNNNF